MREYLSTSFSDGYCEYVDGRVVQRNLGEIDHSNTQSRIVVYLALHYPQYWSAVSVRVQVKPTRIRVPDVVLVAGPKPSGRIEDYLAFGIPYVWVVNPRTGHGYVHTADAAREAKDGILRALDPLIEIPLRDLSA